ncbi:diacylglycerol O-acyltransferase 1-like isoform X2 [Oscarella lobularis]|uniref:diacylglycerol O-acyltransferase 1-like isoform X2 n=1 Tax=Oscarella lobularis TaxID=121494 RepID=UPI003314001C
MEPQATRRRRQSIQTPEDLVSLSETKEKKTKPCHVIQDSLFYTQSGFENYRGVLNLGIILLILSTSRIALDNLIKYGVLVNPFVWIRVFVDRPYEWHCTILVLSLNIYVIFGLNLEKAAVKGVLSSNTVRALWIVLLALLLVVPVVVFLLVKPNPFAAAFALLLHTNSFLKLFSYRAVNAECRREYSTTSPPSKKDDEESGLVQYPDNLNYRDIVYFMLAPTVCYELNFPRTERIRKRFLLKRTIEVVVISCMLLALGQQWLVPTIENSMKPFNELDYMRMLERLLKLAVPNHLLWLMFFYGYFHSLLNAIGEVLRFGDRGFYSDWWNAETIPQFWSDWNVPIHKWARRHVFKPMLQAGYSKLQGALVVFVISAFFHEITQFFSIQIPLAYLTPRFLRGIYGNGVVWLSLILGQPAAILMYCHDYYIMHVAAASENH